MIANQVFHSASTSAQIDTGHVDQLLYWMDLLHADADMLKEAIEAVGPDEDKVREHLNRKRMH